jgi:ribosome maturation factor RimP
VQRTGAASREESVERIRAIAERVAHGYGLEIFDVHLRRESIGWVLRIVIDRPDTGRPGAGAAEESIGIGECERVSHDVSAILDVEDVLDRTYTLEVSSPGLDRPLRHADDYRRFAGRLAKIVVGEPIDGQRHFEGRIEGVDAGVVVLAQGRRTHRIPLSSITRARLEVEFGK